ncbi:hypothetical protein GPL15_18405 [Clostridium sp. MCC353]|uniref:hypothetical protein n=1 Tax=Clostridium sp. MCC353 TaxID=2592646 RepID=UPI001C02971D|nr:hypothetical protein [Clostridium sp. MCC353]MBT9778474.1 hypothetical protein [Clostridium sp. MCC353]
MKKFKALLAVGAAVGLIAAGSMISYADEWKQDDSGRWYQRDDGSYPADGWEWIVQDPSSGLAYCYYFDTNGYLLTDAVTPDGYQVDKDGAWVENGAIQQKNLAAKEAEKDRSGAGQKEEEKETISAEDAKKALYDAEEMSFFYREQAVFDYLEAMGFDTSGLTINREEGIKYSTGVMAGRENSMYEMLKYDSQKALKRIAEYMSGKSYLDKDGEKSDNLIAAVEAYLNR